MKWFHKQLENLSEKEKCYFMKISTWKRINRRFAVIVNAAKHATPENIYTDLQQIKKKSVVIFQILRCKIL